MVSCFYAVVVRGSPDSQANGDDVDRDFRKIEVRYVPGILRSTQNIWSANPSIKLCPWITAKTIP